MGARGATLISHSSDGGIISLSGEGQAWGSERLDELSAAGSHGLPQYTAQQIIPNSSFSPRIKMQKIYVSLESRKGVV